MRKNVMAAAALMAAAAFPALAEPAPALRPQQQQRHSRPGQGRRSKAKREAERTQRGNPAGTKLGKKAEKARTSRRFADTFLASLAAKRITKAKLRDENGAYTLTGCVYEMIAPEGDTITPGPDEHVYGGTFGDGGHTSYTARRKWLGGYSERRGY